MIRLLLIPIINFLCLACWPAVAAAHEYASGKELRAALQDKEAKVRTRAAEQLAAYDIKADPEMVKAVLKALKDTDEDVRRLAADALGNLRGSKDAKLAVPALTEVACKDKEYKIRERAINSLACLESDAKGAVPSLLNCMGDKDPEYRTSILGALTQIDPTLKDVINTFVNSIKDSDRRVRVSANTGLYFATRKGADPKVTVPAMRQALKDENSSVRGLAADHLGYLGTVGASALGELKKMQKDDTNPFVRHDAGRAIARIRKAIEEQKVQ
jgi:HEAT repeat protein